MKINILGTEYEVKSVTRSEDARLNAGSGFIDVTTNQIVVESLEQSGDIQDCANLKKLELQAMRHEITHAFFYESGLWGGYGQDEVLVDWIALQIPKMVEAMAEAGCLELPAPKFDYSELKCQGTATVCAAGSPSAVGYVR